MHSNLRSYRRTIIGLAVLATGLLRTQAAEAAAYYFDLNGTTAGFGVTNGSTYDWTLGTPWTTDGTGASTAAGIAWPGGSNQAYLIGAGASTNYTIRLGSTGASNIVLQNFAINLDSTATGANGLGDVTIGSTGDTGLITLNAGNSFGAQGGGKLTINNPISLAAVSANFRGGNVVLNGVISSTSSSGTLTLGNSGGTFGLPTTGGVLRLGNTANTYTGRTTIGDGFTLEVTKVASAGTANSLGNSTNVASNLQIDGTLRFVGDGTSTGQNSNRGIQFNGDGGTIEASGAGTLNLNTLNPIGFDTTAVNKTVTLGGTNVSSGNIFGGALGDNTVSSVVYPTSLVKTGTGTWTINNANNTFTGSVTVNAGILRVSNSNALGTGTKNFFMQGGSRTLQLSSGTTLGSNITLTVATNTADGTGISSVDSVNAIQGPINISTGLAALNISSLNTSTFTIAGNVTQTTSGRTLYLGGSSTNLNTVSGIIGEATGTSSLPVIKQGVGTWVLTGANTYTGGTTVNAGTLTVGPGGTLGDSAGPLAVNNPNTGAGTVVALNLPTGADLTVGSLSGSVATASSGTNTATINTQAGRVITVNQTTDGTFAGTIAGAGGLTLGVQSTKTLTLTGANTYTGNTTVQAGILTLSGAAGTNVLSNAGGIDVQGGVAKFDSSNLANIASILSAGYALPTRFSAGQIRSTTLAGAATLGYGDDGVNTTVRYTLGGDANLDGKVDFNDFLVLQNSFNNPNTRFDQGNFNYDNITDFNDFLILQNNFGNSITGAAVPFTEAQVAAIQSFAATVPEPTMIACLGLGAVATLRRRRQH